MTILSLACMDFGSSRSSRSPVATFDGHVFLLNFGSSFRTMEKIWEVGVPRTGQRGKNHTDAYAER